jgi:hypothetical protein
VLVFVALRFDTAYRYSVASSHQQRFERSKLAALICNKLLIWSPRSQIESLIKGYISDFCQYVITSKFWCNYSVVVQR